MVRAIDIHIHPPVPGFAVPTEDPATQAYFRSAMSHRTPEEMAEHYAQLDIFGVLFHSDAETATGHKPVPNDAVAELVSRYPKQFIGFGSVDPWKGKGAVRGGRPGGGGVKLKYARPIPYIDDVAADFPHLTVIMAHPSFPWQDEQLAMLVHKPNVYMDLSGWSPQYFSPLLGQYART